MTYVLVGGAARSGTTLLYGVLCSGRQTNPVLFETHLFSHLLTAYSHARYRFEHVDNGQFFSDADTLRGFFSRPLVEFFELVRARYGSPPHLVLKSTVFTPYAAHALDLVADCRVIVSVRDPRDIVASKLEVEASQGKAALGHHTEADVGRVAAVVMRDYQKCLRALPHDRLHFVRYEDLVSVPHEVVSRLSAWTGIDLSGFDPSHAWANSLRDFEADRARGSAYVTDRFGKGISDQRVGRYRRVLRPADVRLVETICDVLMTAFRYRSQEPGHPEAG